MTTDDCSHKRLPRSANLNDEMIVDYIGDCHFTNLEPVTKMYWKKCASVIAIAARALPLRLPS